VSSLPTRPRLGVIVSTPPDFPEVSLVNALTHTTRSFREVFPGAEVVAGISMRLDAEVAAIMNHRALGRAPDAMLEVTLPQGGKLEELEVAGTLLADELFRVADPEGTSAFVGISHFALIGTSKRLLAHYGWRAQGVGPQEFMDWWSGHHADHNRQSASGVLMAGYGLMQRDDALSATINAAAGFKDEGDIYESVYIRDLDKFVAAVTPQIAAAAMRDEVGMFSHHCVRPALFAAL
jgi:hypothetical protein